MHNLKQSVPSFLKTDLEIYYYNYLIDLFEENEIPVKNEDSLTIGAFASNLAVLETTSESIDEHGSMMVVEGDRGIVSKTNPDVNRHKDAQVNLKHYFKEFNLSPNSRGSNGGLQIPTGKQKDDGFGDV